MKKVFSLCLICLLAISAQSQRAAVMEFKAGVGVSQADVDGLSGIFTTYFRPAGYTMIERTQIDRIIDEQQFQRSSLTESQMVRIGELLNLSKIVIGDVNVVMGQYNVDVRVVNVESGTIAATEGATFSGGSYREAMKSLSQKLASQIAITSGPVVGTSNASSQPQQSEYVDLGLPSGTLWKNKNEKGYYNWFEARQKFTLESLPSDEDFQELQEFCTWTWNGNGYIVKGNNGNSIVLPAAGYRDHESGGKLSLVGDTGMYLSSSTCHPRVYFLNFDSYEISIESYPILFQMSIRLIK